MYKTTSTPRSRKSPRNKSRSPSTDAIKACGNLLAHAPNIRIITTTPCKHKIAPDHHINETQLNYLKMQITPALLSAIPDIAEKHDDWDREHQDELCHALCNFNRLLDFHLYSQNNNQLMQNTMEKWGITHLIPPPLYGFDTPKSSKHKPCTDSNRSTAPNTPYHSTEGKIAPVSSKLTALISIHALIFDRQHDHSWSVCFFSCLKSSYGEAKGVHTLRHILSELAYEPNLMEPKDVDALYTRLTNAMEALSKRKGQKQPYLLGGYRKDSTQTLYDTIATKLTECERSLDQERVKVTTDEATTFDSHLRPGPLVLPA